jgi:hypothetical protein
MPKAKGTGNIWSNIFRFHAGMAAMSQLKTA